MHSQSIGTSSESSVAPEKTFSSSRKSRQYCKPVQSNYVVTKSETVSDQQSTNLKYLCKRNVDHERRYFSVRDDMKSVSKNQARRYGAGTSQAQPQDDHEKQELDSKNSFRSPRWPEYHNDVFGELLMEQYMCGNILDGKLKRHIWRDFVRALNRRLGTTYTESTVMTRFKNMKSDFRIVYQLSNKSGWGWDENLHLPIASDEIWEEILQVHPKWARFHRNPFRQFSVFEKICGGNIAIGTDAQSSLPQNTATPEELQTTDLQDSDAHIDTFMASNGVQFEYPYDPPVSPMHVNEPSTQPEAEVGGSGQHSKRASDDFKQSSKKKKKRVDKEALQQLLESQVEHTKMLTESNMRDTPVMMADCLEKIASIENLTDEATLALLDSINNNMDNKVILINLKGRRLKIWIEHIVAGHPRYFASPVWI